MLPEHFYITDLGRIAYAVFYLPLMLGLLWILLRKVKLPWVGMFPIGLVLLTLPFWDVYMIGRDAARLCSEQGGLHVYKMVEAEGFLGDSGIEKWSKYGFSYVESGGGDKMSRYTMQDGKAVHQRIQEFTSRYQGRPGNNHKIITRSISRSSAQVVDLKTSEVLGELVTFNIYPGRFDGIFLKLAGSGPMIWFCGNESPPGSNVLRLGLTDVILATIKPLEE